MLVLHPNDDDYRGLADAFENNSLTHRPEDRHGPGHDEHAFFADLPYQVSRGPPRTFSDGSTSSEPKKPFHSWFQGVVRRTLYDQDLLNAFFAYRTMHLPAGYNIWAEELEDALEPGKLFGTAEEVEKYVGRKVHSIHGTLWRDRGYTALFNKRTRALWLEVWLEVGRCEGCFFFSQPWSFSLYSCILCFCL